MQRSKQIHEKYKVTSIITRILTIWEKRKYEHDATKLQKAADNNNLNPIWKYQRSTQRKKWTNATCYTKTTETPQKQWKDDKKDGQNGSKHAPKRHLGRRT